MYCRLLERGSTSAVTASTSGANIAYWSLLRGKSGPPTEVGRVGRVGRSVGRSVGSVGRVGRFGQPPEPPLLSAPVTSAATVSKPTKYISTVLIVFHEVIFQVTLFQRRCDTVGGLPVRTRTLLVTRIHPAHQERIEKRSSLASTLQRRSSFTASSFTEVDLLCIVF